MRALARLHERAAAPDGGLKATSHSDDIAEEPEDLAEIGFA
jgi:hypothetical protein